MDMAPETNYEYGTLRTIITSCPLLYHLLKEMHGLTSLEKRVGRNRIPVTEACNECKLNLCRGDDTANSLHA